MDFLKRALEKLTGEGKALGEIKNPSEQPEDQQDLIAYIRNKIQEVRMAGSRVSHEGVWMTNYAYLLGFDSVYYDTNSRQFRAMGGAKNRRNSIHINKILPTVQRRQARLGKNPARFEVRPDDSTQDSRDRARLEQQVLESYIEKENVSGKRNNMLIGLQQCGHFYLGVNWNPERGELLSAPIMSEETPIDNGQSQEVKEQIDYEYEGDCDIEIVHPLEIFPDPLATCLEDAQWIIRAKVRKLDYFRSHYPERGSLVKEEDAWLLSTQYEMRIQSLVGQGPAQTGVQMQMENSAIELIYYEKRSKKHPNGRMSICASGVLLHDGELPVGEIPLAKFDDIPITGKYYSEALVTHLRPIQDQFNRLITKRSRWTDLMLAGKWSVPRGSELQQEALTNDSGEVLYYTPVPGAPPPSAMQVPAIPQYAYTEEDKLNGMFYDIAGEGEVSRGILPAAGIPAIGMELLLEQDETRIGAETQQHEIAMARIGMLILKYLEKFVTNERLLKISDPTQQYVVKKFSGSDLKSKHDVIVIPGSLAPTNKATKRNDLTRMYTMGLLGDPNAPEVKAKFLRDLEYGDAANVWIDQSIDMTQVKKSLEMIESGEIPEISEFDNHTLHLQEKNRYRKTDKYTNLDPRMQAIFLNDMDEHLQWLMKLTAGQFGMNPDPNADVDQAVAREQQNMDMEQRSMEQSAQMELNKRGAQ